MPQRGKLPLDEIVKKLDEFFGRNDVSGAEEHLIYWLKEADTVGDNAAELFLNNELMGFYRKAADREKAYSFAEAALKLIDKMGIEDNVGAATTYLNAATVYKAFSEPSKALPLYNKARTIYEKRLFSYDARLAGLYNNTALALVDLGRFSEANELYQKALAVLEQNEGSEPEQAVTQLNIASAVEAERGLEEGDGEIANRVALAWELLESCAEQTDGNYAFVCEKCASVFGYYGYFEYESVLTERARRIYEGA